VVERIFKYKIQQQIYTDDMQFGFMRGKGTTYIIFSVREMQEKFRDKGKLYFGFVDLEKAPHRVPRESLRMVSIGSHVYVRRCKNSCKNSLW